MVAPTRTIAQHKQPDNCGWRCCGFESHQPPQEANRSSQAWDDLFDFS